MIFYCSPTKTLKKVEFTKTVKPIFNQQTQNIMSELKKLSLSELKAFYHASDKIVEHQYSVIHTPVQLGPSGFVYQGASFKSLDLSSINNDYLNERLFIGSALYGLTKIESLIHDHRLDFTKNLTDINLIEYWKPLVTRYLKKLKQPIIDVSSQEYGQLIEDLNPIKIEFIDQGKIKSTYAKAARGLFIRECALRQVDAVSDLNKIKVLDYQYDSELSSENRIVFSR